MTMTEEEAQAKWCPFSRNQHMQGANRRTGGEGGVGCCIGSQCMAWRQMPQMWEHRNSSGATWTEPKEQDGYGQRGKKLPLVGYCGLAGKPE